MAEKDYDNSVTESVRGRKRIGNISLCQNETINKNKKCMGFLMAQYLVSCYSSFTSMIWLISRARCQKHSLNTTLYLLPNYLKFGATQARLIKHLFGHLAKINIQRLRLNSPTWPSAYMDALCILIM